MADYTQSIIDRWSTTGSGTNAGVSSTHGLVLAQAHTATSIQCSSDLAAVVTIESPAGVVLWRKRYAAAFTMSEVFPPGTINGAYASDILVKVSASTAACEANMQGFTVLAHN